MFVKKKLIRFHHCDPAGIVFYPQYFVLFHELIEDWFNEGMGVNYAEFVRRRGMGLPMVKLACEFLAPNSIGDILALDLTVRRIGTSSIDLGVRGTAHGRECVRATLTVVHTSIKEMRSVPLPDELRSAVARFMER
jgi:4-hydroxybenzoyl-CoA thioesterase